MLQVLIIQIVLVIQEYREVFPDSVKGSGEFLEGDDVELLQMDSYNAQIVSVKAIQEQQKIIELQAKQIEEILNEIKILKNI